MAPGAKFKGLEEFLKKFVSVSFLSEI